MHARSALPCAWALGAVLVLTGCATRALSTEVLLDATPAMSAATPALVESPLPPALRARPAALELLRPNAEGVPVGRATTVHPALAAPCALPPEMASRGRAGAADYDLSTLHAEAVERHHGSADHCAGGT